MKGPVYEIYEHTYIYDLARRWATFVEHGSAVCGLCPAAGQFHHQGAQGRVRGE